MMRSLIVSMSLLCTGLAFPSGTRAESFFFSGTGHWYTATDSTMTWTEADALATSLGGYLVSVLSQAESDFLQETFFPVEAEAFWIGFTDQTQEGTFVWTSGEPVTFTRWGSNQPDNFMGGVAAGIGEDYTQINWQFANGVGPRGFWNDSPNQGILPFGPDIQPYRAIIEFNFDPAVIPEPTSAIMLGVGVAGVLSYSLRRRRADRA